MVDVNDGTAVCPDDRAVDHLQHVRVATTVGKGAQHRVEAPQQRPAAELPPHRVPLAEIHRQIPPSRPGPGHPEYAFQHSPMRVAGRPVEQARKGSKNAHSSSDIRPRNTANLLGRGWLRITRRRVGGIRYFRVCPQGLEEDDHGKTWKARSSDHGVLTVRVKIIVTRR